MTPSCGQGGEEESDLVVHVGRICQRACDLLTELGLEPFPKGLGGIPNGSLGESQPNGCLRMRRTVGLTVEILGKVGEQLGASKPLILASQAFECGIKHGPGTAAVEGQFGR